MPRATPPRAGAAPHPGGAPAPRGRTRARPPAGGAPAAGVHGVREPRRRARRDALRDRAILAHAERGARDVLLGDERDLAARELAESRGECPGDLAAEEQRAHDAAVGLD